ncbi:MAG: DUF3108 domain-containing protein [Alphaproteobacteria bacterium]|nr:DUF3108 domain-containing protein [Alphaproteobacteria bacterium]HPF46089.1 DUF3108 domain-containing protein [Emcibacteraceae bacterium]
MKRIYGVFLLSILFSAQALAQIGTPYKVDMTYKAYWGGFVVAEIHSETALSATGYQLSADYKVKGFAAIISDMENRTMSRGILYTDGKYRPEYYESGGNFGKLKYKSQVSFDPKTLNVTNLVQEMELRKDSEYVPIEEDEKYGMDPMTMFLNLIMTPNFKEAYREKYSERQFGGMFVSEQSFTCDETEMMGRESRSVFEGEAIICKIDGKEISGDIKSTKPKKKKKRKSRERDDQDSRLWFGKMPGFEGTVPVYTEFPIGWGKVRVYLSDFSVTPLETPTITARGD